MQRKAVPIRCMFLLCSFFINDYLNFTPNPKYPESKIILLGYVARTSNNKNIFGERLSDVEHG